MPHFSRLGGTVLLGLVVLVGFFAVASNDFAYGSQSLLAATVSFFSSKPLLTISRNVNSPSGTILPGRSQVFAVFDLKGEGLTDIGHITTVPIFIKTSGNGAPDLSISNVTLNYKYCRPRGNIYAYGYKYGYNGLYCVSITTIPTSSTGTRSGQGMEISFSGIDFPVFPDQVSAILTISGNPYYKNAATALRSAAKVQARLSNGIVAQTQSCRFIRYGYQNRYGYTKCSPLKLSTNLWVAYGNTLTVLRSYGYGYGYGYGYPITPYVKPPMTPDVAPPTSTGSGNTSTTVTPPPTTTTGAGSTTTTPPPPAPPPPKPAPLCILSASPASVTVGQTTTIKWVSTNAAYVVDSAGVKLATSGNNVYTVSNVGINVFTFTAYDGIDKQSTCSVNVVAVVAPAPTTQTTPKTSAGTNPTPAQTTIISNPNRQFFQTEIE